MESKLILELKEVVHEVHTISRFVYIFTRNFFKQIRVYALNCIYICVGGSCNEGNILCAEHVPFKAISLLCTKSVVDKYDFPSVNLSLSVDMMHVLRSNNR